MVDVSQLAPSLRLSLMEGGVIPAHPLALDRERRFSENHQRALTRYYLDAGATGIAVGVHTTQFAIRDAKVGLLKPVLALAAETITEYERRYPGESILRVAGVCGKTKQAVSEARLASETGYHMGLLSLGALQEESIDDLLEHIRAVSAEIPLMGFYLQPSVGGRELPYEFWRRFCEVPNLAAIKIAAFNRYQTLDVVRAVAESDRCDEIALYTGNDDNIVLDLLSTYRFHRKDRAMETRFRGGLLGHWAVWTRTAVMQWKEIQRVLSEERGIPLEMLILNHQVTDCNAAFFDAANRFQGCIAGINEILARQGLLPSRCCLDPEEDLSPGQKEEIDRVCAAYPHLNDNEFVAEHLEAWLS